MPRIRWYHFFLVLALSDVVVIMLSLQLHKETLRSFEEFREETIRLQSQADWVLATQQRIIELNAPGNDLFAAQSPDDYALIQRRHRKAKQNMRTVLDDAPDIRRTYPSGDPVEWAADLGQLQSEIDQMTIEADRLVAAFDFLNSQSLSEPEKEERLGRAGPIMARMDLFQHKALASLSRLSQRSTGYRNELMARHEDDLDGRMYTERVVIALVVILLGGLLLFGRRLQRIDKALESEKLRVKEERRERLAAIGELCSSVAHGIRNPLAAIRSSAQLALQVGKMDEDSTDRLKDILNEGRRLGDRVTGLLNMARSSQEAFEEIELNSLVTQASRELKPELARRGIQLSETLLSEPVRIFGDRRYLEQAVIELVSNAMEQSRSGDVISVECAVTSAGCDAVVGVEDQGAGVPDGIRARIFDLFFTTKPTGTGIGLATVKRVAKLHGGDVHLRPGKPSGARFELVIPIMRTGRRAGERKRLELLNLL